MNEALLKFVKENFSQPGRVLDLGAGTGVDLKGFDELGWTTEGVDLKSGTNLDEVYSSNNAPFDLVYSCYVWHRLKNRLNIATTAFKNVRPGGRAFFHLLHKNDKNSISTMDETDVKTALESVGFSDVLVSVFDKFDDDVGHKHWHKIIEATAVKNK